MGTTSHESPPRWALIHFAPFLPGLRFLSSLYCIVACSFFLLLLFLSVTTAISFLTAKPKHTYKTHKLTLISCPYPDTTGTAPSIQSTLEHFRDMNPLTCWTPKHNHPSPTISPNTIAHTCTPYSKILLTYFKPSLLFTTDEAGHSSSEAFFQRLCLRPHARINLTSRERKSSLADRNVARSLFHAGHGNANHSHMTRLPCILF